MWQDGVPVIVPMWRTDIYGNELVVVKDDFQKLRGTWYDGIGYVPGTGDFTASLNRINFIVWSQDLRNLSSKVSEAIHQERGIADKVGVYLVAYGEVVPIFIQAQNQPVLSKVKWYGCDSFVASKRLVSNTEAALFAVKTRLINPIYAVDNSSSKFKLVDNKIREIIGRVPTPYADVAYDAIWVAALTENATSGTKDINYLKKTFLQIANSVHRNYR